MKFHIGAVRYFFFLLFCSEWISGASQSIAATHPPYFSTLNCYSKNFLDVFSITGNVAALALLDKPAAGIYTEKRFVLDELSQYTLVGNIATRIGAFAIQLNYFGHPNYKETEPSIAYAKQLGGIELGIRFNYRMLSVASYGSTASIIPEIGTIWHITEKVQTGIHIRHPLSFFPNVEKPAHLYSSGIGYEISSVVFIGAGIVKEENKNASIYTALQYQLQKKFFAHIGISTGGSPFRFAFGYQPHSLKLQITLAWDARLGISPGLMIVFTSKGKK